MPAVVVLTESAMFVQAKSGGKERRIAWPQIVSASRFRNRFGLGITLKVRGGKNVKLGAPPFDVDELEELWRVLEEAAVE